MRQAIPGFCRAKNDQSAEPTDAVVSETMAVDSQELRRVLGHFVTGVTVTTTKDVTGAPFGLTANASTWLSLDQPLARICVDTGTQCYSCFADSNLFTVNFLGEHQEEI